MEGSGGYDHYGLMEEEEGYRTPTHEGCRIPRVAVECPPAPKRKRVYMKKQQRRNSTPQQPKDGYFQHPDIDLLFKMMSTTREPYVQVQLQAQACFERGPGSTCC